MSADKDRGEEPGYVSDGHAEEHCGTEIGLIRTERRYKGEVE